MWPHFYTSQHMWLCCNFYFGIWCRVIDFSCLVSFCLLIIMEGLWLVIFIPAHSFNRFNYSHALTNTQTIKQKIQTHTPTPTHTFTQAHTLTHTQNILSLALSLSLSLCLSLALSLSLTHTHIHIHAHTSTSTCTSEPQEINTFSPLKHLKKQKAKMWSGAQRLCRPTYQGDTMDALGYQDIFSPPRVF
jgi:hypothetical protein